MGIDHRSYRIRGVMKTVNKFKTQRDQKRDSQQNERQGARCVDRGKVSEEVHPRVDESDDESDAKNGDPNLARQTRPSRHFESSTLVPVAIAVPPLPE